MKILALNAGSSSLRARLAELSSDVNRSFDGRWRAHVSWKTPNDATLKIESGAGRQPLEQSVTGDLKSVVPRLLEQLWSGDHALLGSPAEIDAVGHRVVHGGGEFAESAVIDDGVIHRIEELRELAPLHNESALEVIHVARRQIPAARHVAVFDTGFHRTLPEAARIYPGPREWIGKGIRRYGFHGISYRYASRRAAEIVGRPLPSLRMMICHLGSGASLAAVRNGQSVDTTMGFTPLEGLMMATRSGTVDPGILLHLMRRENCSADDLDRILNKQSGLEGLAGSSSMRDVLRGVEAGDADCRLAFDVYTHRLAREACGMLAGLGGLDVLVFTGGVGENSPPVRERLCHGMGFLGIQIDAHRNEASPPDVDISVPGSPVRVLIVRAEEETEIIRMCFEQVTGEGLPPTARTETRR